MNKQLTKYQPQTWESFWAGFQKNKNKIKRFIKQFNSEYYDDMGDYDFETLTQELVESLRINDIPAAYKYYFKGNKEAVKYVYRKYLYDYNRAYIIKNNLPHITIMTTDYALPQTTMFENLTVFDYESSKKYIKWLRKELNGAFKNKQWFQAMVYCDNKNGSRDIESELFTKDNSAKNKAQISGVLELIQSWAQRNLIDD